MLFKKYGIVEFVDAFADALSKPKPIYLLLAIPANGLIRQYIIKGTNSNL
jgi:hypothetical protein